jgi:predicted nucleic acid-binding protein
MGGLTNGDCLFRNQFCQFAGGISQPGFDHSGEPAGDAGLVAAEAAGFFCIASDEVTQEASKGDPGQARRRLEVLKVLTFVQPSREAEDLAQAFRATGALPPNAQTDAAHLAIATAASADYLLTWNSRHLANAQILRRLEREALRHGWTLPNVCTPTVLMGDLPYESESDS